MVVSLGFSRPTTEISPTLQGSACSAALPKRDEARRAPKRVEARRALVRLQLRGGGGCSNEVKRTTNSCQQYAVTTGLEFEILVET